MRTHTQRRAPSGSIEYKAVSLERITTKKESLMQPNGVSHPLDYAVPLGNLPHLGESSSQQQKHHFDMRYIYKGISHSIDYCGKSIESNSDVYEQGNG